MLFCPAMERKERVNELSQKHIRTVFRIFHIYLMNRREKRHLNCRSFASDNGRWRRVRRTRGEAAQSEKGKQSCCFFYREISILRSSLKSFLFVQEANYTAAISIGIRNNTQTHTAATPTLNQLKY